MQGELDKLKYEVKFGSSLSNKKLFIITGWTIVMRMSNDIVLNWTKEMCEMGYNFDCDFDGNEITKQFTINMKANFFIVFF